MRITLILFFLAVAIAPGLNPIGSYNGFDSYAEYAAVRNAMAWHGTLDGVCEDGVYSFERSGERVELGRMDEEG